MRLLMGISRGQTRHLLCREEGALPLSLRTVAAGLAECGLDAKPATPLGSGGAFDAWLIVITHAVGW